MATLLTLGEPLAVFASTEEGLPLQDATHFEKHLAGAEANVAIGTVRLGHQARYLAQVGADPMGAFIQAGLAAAGVDTRAMATDRDHPTGVQFKAKTAIGDPEIFYLRRNSAGAHTTPALVTPSVLTDVAAAHLTGIFAALSADARATMAALIHAPHQAHVPISFDPNIRPALWPDSTTMVMTLNALAAQAQLVLPGIKEGQLLTGRQTAQDIAAFYFAQSTLTTTVVIKDGPRGAHWFTRAGASGFVASFQAQVVDTVGAGDGFALGVVTALMEGLTLPQAVQRGTAIGARAVMAPGDNDGYPTRQALDAFITRAASSKES